MLGFVEHRLIQSGHLKWPEVYLSPDLEPRFAARLRDIVKSHRGKIVTSIAKATHVVEHKHEADPDEDPDLEYLRTIEHRDKMNLVHWWYYPDSYDTWLPATEVQGEQPDPDPPHLGVWRVSPRYLTDLEMYNEWMNELDYEIEDEEAEVEGTPKGRGRGKGRKGSRKRNNTVDEEEPPKKDSAKKPKVRKGREDEEEDVEVEVDEMDASKLGKKNISISPSALHAQKDKLKIKIPREMVVCT